MSTNQLESTVIDPNTTDLLEKLLFAYSCALTGFKRFPTHKDREAARLKIVNDPGWEKVGLPAKSDVAALLRQHGIAMPAPLVD
ncbi:MAG: hypothetical protein PHI35_08305 [Victivallaceae bacterium]|nr:hypothetical protein [Victivallaceae bacterium]